MTQAARYGRNEQHQDYRSGYYSRRLTTTSEDVTIKAPKLKEVFFETAIIERYHRQESSVKEALIEIYLVGVSVRCVETSRGPLEQQGFPFAACKLNKTLKIGGTVLHQHILTFFGFLDCRKTESRI